MYAEKSICVTGVVKEYNGKPEIIVSSALNGHWIQEHYIHLQALQKFENKNIFNMAGHFAQAEQNTTGIFSFSVQYYNFHLL